MTGFPRTVRMDHREANPTRARLPEWRWSSAGPVAILCVRAEERAMEESEVPITWDQLPALMDELREAAGRPRAEVEAAIAWGIEQCWLRHDTAYVEYKRGMVVG